MGKQKKGQVAVEDESPKEGVVPIETEAQETIEPAEEVEDEIIPETLGVDVSENVKLDDVAIKPDETPVIEVEDIKSSDPVSKKVKVRFLKDLTPRVYMCGEWISGKKGDDKFVTTQQANILRSDETVI